MTSNMPRFIAICSALFFLSAPLAAQEPIEGSNSLKADWCTKGCYGPVVERGPLNDKGNKHGQWIGHYKNTKNIALKGMYANGKRAGQWTFFALPAYVKQGDGRVLQGSYDKGIKVKTWTQWSEMKQTATATYSNQGRTRVDMFTLYARQKVMQRKLTTLLKEGVSTAQWVDHGPYTIKEKGVLIEKGTFHDGKLHGLHQRWSRTGEVASYGTYKQGVKVGTHHSFNVGDAARCEETYNKTKGHHTCWWPNKAMHSRVPLRVSKRPYSSWPDKGWAQHGIFESWSAQGQLMSKGSYVYGQQVKTWTTWHPNGKRESVGEYILKFHSAKRTKYKQSFRHGVWAFYHDNGQLQTKGTYTQSRKSGIWHTWTRDGGKDSIEVYSYRSNSPMSVKPWL